MPAHFMRMRNYAMIFLEEKDKASVDVAENVLEWGA